MKKREFQRVLAIATSGEALLDADDRVLDGFGLPGFQPVTVTARAAARTLRWQVVRLDGSIDSVELTTIANLWRKRVILAD